MNKTMNENKNSKMTMLRSLLSIQFIVLFCLISNNIYSQEKNAIFDMNVIDSNIPGVNCIKIFDIDLDGDYDIIGGSETTPWTSSVGLKWWRNEGGNPIIWTKFTIDAAFLHVMSVDVANLNNDSFPDIVATSWENGKVSWWKNSGDPTAGWEIFDIKSGWSNAHDAKCFDINGDSLTDVVGVSAGNNTISVFYNQGGLVPSWNENIVTSTFNHALSISIADLNNDGFPDIIGSADGADDIAWWKQSVTTPTTWQKYTIDNNFIGAGNTTIIDLNNDGQLDVIGTAWESNEISYWISTDINSSLWIKTELTTDIEIPVKVSVNDIDNDSDLDIITKGKIPGELSVFYNDSSVYTNEILYSDGGAALSVFDIDKDGDFDIISGAENNSELIIFYYIGNNNSINGNTFPGVICSLYPNPSVGKIQINCKQVIDKITILDYTGKEIFHSYPQLNNVTLQLYDNGIYFAIINCKEKTILKKIMIQKE